MVTESDIPKMAIDNELERIASHPDTPAWVGKFATGLVTTRRIIRTPSYRLRQKVERLETRAKAFDERQAVRLQEEIERHSEHSEK